MKKIILAILLVIGLVATVLAWFVIGSGTAFPDKQRYLYVRTGKATKDDIMEYIKQNNLLKNPGVFEMLANRMNVWDKVNPGRFEIKKGESILSIARMLRNNKQSPVNFVINKI